MISQNWNIFALRLWCILPLSWRISCIRVRTVKIILYGRGYFFVTLEDDIRLYKKSNLFLLYCTAHTYPAQNASTQRHGHSEPSAWTFERGVYQNEIFI